jgi:KDO2-lipid IV(A) lauroyltransferase
MEPAARRLLARRMWSHLLLMVCEVAHTPRKIHRTNWHRYVTIQQKRLLVRYLLGARPTLLVSGHFGNFELGGYVTGLLGFPTFTVARPLDNPFLDRFINRFRSAHGQYIVPKEKSAQQIDALLSRGATLSVLGDQHAGTKGCWVDFFGRPASCHKAIALFALTSKAPLLVAFARRTAPLKFEVGLAGVSDPASAGDEQAGVVALTQWYNRCLERLITTAPEQYWWLHRRWKPPAPPRHRRAAALPAA